MVRYPRNTIESSSESDYENTELPIQDNPEDEDFIPGKSESEAENDVSEYDSDDDSIRLARSNKAKNDKAFINDNSDLSEHESEGKCDPEFQQNDEDSDDYTGTRSTRRKRLKTGASSSSYNLRSANKKEESEAESTADNVGYRTRLRTRQNNKNGIRGFRKGSKNFYGTNNQDKDQLTDLEHEPSKLNELDDEAGLQRLFRGFTNKKETDKVKKNVILPDNLEIINDERLKLLSEDDKLNSFNLNKKPVTWNQFGGLKKQIQTLNQTLVLPTKYKALYDSINLKPENGFLFYGPPGTGKTMVAQALANDTSSNGKPWAFFFRNSTEFLSKYYGDGEKNLTQLFETARKWSPAIIYLDEIDALAPSRIESEETHLTAMVSTLLGLMDGAVEREGVVVIASTNHPETIDPALRRPGRFGTELLFTLPDHYSRMEVFSKITQSWPVPPPNDLIDWLATRTNGYTPADIKLVCNESLLQAKIQSSLINRASDLPLQVNKLHFEQSLATFVPTGRRALSMDVFPLPFYQSALLQSEVDHCCQWFAPYLESPTVTPLVPQLPKSLVLYGSNSYILSSIGSAVLNQLAVDRILTLSASDLVRQSDGITVPQALKRQLASIPMHPIAFTTSVIYIPFIDSSPRIFSQVISILNMYLKHLSPLCQVVLLITSNSSPEDFGYDFLQPPQAQFYEVNSYPNQDQRSKFLINLLEAAFASKLPKPDKESLFRGRFSPPNPKSANSLVLNDGSNGSDLVCKDLVQLIHGCLHDPSFALLCEPMFLDEDWKPGYTKMCLLTILEKLADSSYETFEQVLEDLNAIVNNVLFFLKEPGHFIAQTVLQLEYDIYHNLGTKYPFVFDQYNKATDYRMENLYVAPPPPEDPIVEAEQGSAPQVNANGHSNGDINTENKAIDQAESQSFQTTDLNLEHTESANAEPNGTIKAEVYTSVTTVETKDNTDEIKSSKHDLASILTNDESFNGIDALKPTNIDNILAVNSKSAPTDIDAKLSIPKLLVPESPNDVSSTCMSTTSTYYLPSIIDSWYRKEYETFKDIEDPNSVYYLNTAHKILMQKTERYSISQLLEFSCSHTLANANTFKDLCEVIKVEDPQSSP